MEMIKMSKKALERVKVLEMVGQKKKKPKHRFKSPRKKCFGEMIQMDGSIHDWFGDKKVCLINEYGG